MWAIARLGFRAAVLLAICAVSKAAEPEPVFQAVDAFIASQDIDFESDDWNTLLDPPPELDFDSGKTYRWLLETGEGLITFELYPDIAPRHVSSTIYLTRLGFFDGLVFHRIIRGLLAQSGDPLGNGLGHPGYLLDGEFTRQRKGKHRKAGTLSAANRGPGTDGSQFFITFAALKQLDGKHTVFGQMVDGKKVLRALDRAGSAKGVPKKRIEVISAKIEVE